MSEGSDSDGVQEQKDETLPDPALSAANQSASADNLNVPNSSNVSKRRRPITSINSGNLYDVSQQVNIGQGNINIDYAGYAGYQSRD